MGLLREFPIGLRTAIAALASVMRVAFDARTRREDACLSARMDWPLYANGALA